MKKNNRYYKQYIMNGFIWTLFLLMWSLKLFNNPVPSLYKQFFFLIFIVLGLTIEILSGVLNLSCVAEISMATYIGVFILNHGLPVIAAAACVLLFHVVSGALRGSLIARLKINPIITTFALQLILLNLSPLLFGKNIVFNSGWHLYNSKITWAAAFAVFAALFILLQFLMKRTYYGKYIRILGTNPDIFTRSGLDYYHIRIIICVLSSLIYFFATMLFLLTISKGGNLDDDYIFLAVSAVCLGGADLITGSGSIQGSVFGTLSIVIMTLILVYFGLQNKYGNIIAGFIILFSILSHHRISGILSRNIMH